MSRLRASGRASLIRALARAPLSLLESSLGRLVGGQRVALCLHRVTPGRRKSDPVPSMSVAPADLDALLSLLASCRPRGERPWLVLTFDDGYQSAIEYVADRAPRHPDAEWRVFVCPEKVEKRAGFRWDLFELRGLRGEGERSFLDVLNEPVDPARENDRPELRELGDRPEFALGTVAGIRALATLPNVELGNHGNSHLRSTDLSEDAFRAELMASATVFERLFGRPARHYAFPFGTPGLEFHDRHVEIARELGPTTLWTTAPGLYPPEAERPGATLPRLPIDGRVPPREIVAWTLLVAARSRLRPSPSLRFS